MDRVTRLARALLLVAVLALLAAVAVGEADAGSSASTVTVASITTGDVRVVVRATKSGAGQAPVARVTATTFARSSVGWRATAVRRLAGPFFWNVLTGPRAVCRFEVATAGSASGFRPRAVVQLLLTPSVGCGRATILRLGA